MVSTPNEMNIQKYDLAQLPIDLYYHYQSQYVIYAIRKDCLAADFCNIKKNAQMSKLPLDIFRPVL